MKKYMIMDLQGGELYQDKIKTLKEWKEIFIKLEEERVYSFGISSTTLDVIRNLNTDEILLNYLEKWYEIKFMEV